MTLPLPQYRPGMLGVMMPAEQAQNKEVKVFRREDYWSFVLGIFVLGGLLLFPLGLRLEFGFSYYRGLVASFLVCGAIAYAHRRDGGFSFGRLILGVTIAHLVLLYFSLASGEFRIVVPGGVIGFLIAEGCGWIGIAIGRTTGLSSVVNRLALRVWPDTPVLPAMPTLALRYLEKRHITHFAIVAVALCVFIVVVVMTVMNGLVQGFKEKNHAFVGDCVVGTESLVGFPYYEEFMAVLERSELAAGISPVIKNYALLNVPGYDFKRGVEIMGIDPTRHCQTTDFAETLLYHNGDPRKVFQTNADGNTPGCVAGVDMFLMRNAQGEYARGGRALQLNITLTCFPLNARGAPAKAGTSIVNTQQFFCVDHSHSGIARVDESAVYIPLEQAQVLCMGGADKRVTSLHIKFRPGIGVQEGTARVADLWRDFAAGKAEAPNRFLLDTVTVQTWKESRRAFIAPMEKEQVLLGFMFILVGVTTVFIVFVVFYMIISHKKKDIGILKSVGASNGSVLSLFQGFAFSVGFLGACLGSLFGWLFLAKINDLEQWLFEHFHFQLWDRTIYAIGEIPNRVEPAVVAVIVCCAVVSCLIGALIPSYLAVRLRPVETLHALRT